MLRQSALCVGVLFGFAHLVVAADAPPPAVAKPTTADRIHELVFARRDANDVFYPHMVDPPVWGNTRHLLEGESHARMLKLLDDVVAEPLDDSKIGLRRRALLQHELWRLFDWALDHELSEQPATAELRRRLAAAIRHVALNKSEIEALPSNLPTTDAVDAAPNVLDRRAGWIALGRPDGEAVAPQHMTRFRGRSAFGVFLRHAEGADQGAAFLKRLAEVPFPLRPEHEHSSSLVYDAAHPQYPAGTKVALLRRMLLLDRVGNPVGSPIVQSLQMRTFLKVEPQVAPDHVRMQEFTLDRAAYIAGGAAALHTVGPDDREPTVFLSHEYDEFERRNSTGPAHPQPLILANCLNCHRNPGMLSVNSYTGILSRTIGNKNPRLEPLEFDREIGFTAAWKREHPSWRSLNSAMRP